MRKRDIIERLPIRKIIDSATNFFPLMVIWVLLIVLISILEQLLTGITHGFSDERGLVLRSLVNRILFAIYSSAIIYPIFFILTPATSSNSLI